MRLVENEPAPYTLRGEEFAVGGPTWECPDTGERYLSPEQVDEFFRLVHAAWRARHGIGKDALRQRRKALGLSAAQSSALLGFGVNQYRTYENTDKLPSKSNAVLLKLWLDDDALAALLEAAEGTLTKVTRGKLGAYLAQLAIPSIPLRAIPTSDALGADWSGGATAVPAAPTDYKATLSAEEYSYAMAA